MPSDPRDIMTAMVHPEEQSNFLMERKWLRDARMRWIDEHEMPETMMARDANGNMVPTPFLVGKIHAVETSSVKEAAEVYGQVEKRKPTFTPNELDSGQAAVRDQLDRVIAEANQLSGIMVSDGRGGEVSFSAKSDHPPMQEGESYEEWYSRVRDTYLANDPTRYATQAGPAAADTDAVRGPERDAHDPASDRRPAPAPGTAVCDGAGGDLDCDAIDHNPLEQPGDGGGSADDSSGKPAPDPTASDAAGNRTTADSE